MSVADRLDAIAAAKADNSPQFRRLDEGRYRLTVPAIAGMLEVDYLRREGGQLKAEILVRCELSGARTHDGVLTVGDLNLSSTRTRASMARDLEERARTKKGEIDWRGILEELCQRVLAAERDGEPAVELDTVERPGPDEYHRVEGWELLAKQPTILFGDGGTAKSYLALWAAGTIAARGTPVAYCDWELAAEPHRDRLERLFGPAMPTIHYVRCSRPLIHEADRLRRVVREVGCEYIVLDSIAFACDGPPEQADVAARYFQGLRRLGDQVGSLHVAHVTKALEGGDRRPFGSIFWHNGARATWNIKRAEGLHDDPATRVALHQRKANLGPIRPSFGLELMFHSSRTAISRFDLDAEPDLAADLPVHQRMLLALRSGPLDRNVLADQIDANPETVRKMAYKHKAKFKILDGGKLSLLETRL